MLGKRFGIRGAEKCRDGWYSQPGKKGRQLGRVRMVKKGSADSLEGFRKRMDRA